MNYLLHYNKLIEKHGYKTKPEGYCELHHINPRSHGGSDDSSNLVYVSARVHYLAHWLLAKVHKSPEMIHAFHMMSNCSRYTAKGFALARALKADVMKVNNPMFNPELARKQGLKMVKPYKKERAKGKDQSKNRSDSLIGNQRNAKLKYIVTFPNGETEVVTSMRAFSKEHGLNQTCMTRVCKGKLESHFGFKATYTANE